MLHNAEIIISARSGMDSNRVQPFVMNPSFSSLKMCFSKPFINLSMNYIIYFRY